MKKLLTILLIFASLAVNAQQWYVATAANGGSDTGGDGSIAEPWLTLKHAADTITGAAFVGDTITLGAGTFNETVQVVWDENIRIIGVIASPLTTIITSSNALNPIILGTSAADGTDGNQSLSYIAFDGNLTALTAVSITGRSNVKFHHLTIIDFVNGGIGMRGAVSGTDPMSPATGNEIHDCTITNSSTRSGTGADGLIWMSGQTGALIYDNILDQTDKAAGSNGNIINAVGGGSEANSGFNIGIKYYRNKSYKNASEGAEWNFHIESWDAQGWEIYDSEFYGGGVGIDIGGYVNDKGAYDYSFYVHNCFFGQDAMQPINADGYQTIGIDVESATSDVIITQCHFRNLQWGVYQALTVARAQNNIFVNYNLFENCGVTDNQWGGAAMLAAEGTTPAYTNIYYDNNTMEAGRASAVGAAFYIALTQGTATDIYFRNNVTRGFWHGPIWIYTGAGQTGTLYHQNNLHYNDADAIYYSAGETITTIVAAGNITATDPLFVSTSDFHLQSTSQAINAGINTSAITGGLDFHGASLYGAAYDIGAFEYGLNRLVKMGTTILTINYKIILIDH